MYPSRADKTVHPSIHRDEQSVVKIRIMADGFTMTNLTDSTHKQGTILVTFNSVHINLVIHSFRYCLGGAAVRRRRTRDRKVACSTPGRGAIKSTRSTQPSIPLG